MKPEETIDFHIRWAWHSIARLYNGQAEKHDLSMSTGYVLLNIDQRSGTPSTKLGPKMGMEPRSLTRTLKAMEEDGLIMRKSDKSDKRMVRIHLTELGRKKREISKQAVIRFNEYIGDRISKTKLQHFFDVMEHLNHILEEETPEHLFGKKQ
ncbi:MAG: MarR family transcriptional regulator [Flavobacteriales bacterium]|nr:MarR family transcriptional regulator [Flavobacteriales bacterium]